MDYYNDRQKDFFWGALVGGTVATLATLLFTTKKGQQLQNQVIEAYENAEESVKDFWTASKEKGEELAEKGEKAAKNVGKKIASQFETEDKNHK